MTSFFSAAGGLDRRRSRHPRR